MKSVVLIENIILKGKIVVNKLLLLYPTFPYSLSAVFLFAFYFLLLNPLLRVIYTKVQQ